MLITSQEQKFLASILCLTYLLLVSLQVVVPLTTRGDSVPVIANSSCTLPVLSSSGKHSSWVLSSSKPFSSTVQLV